MSERKIPIKIEAVPRRYRELLDWYCKAHQYSDPDWLGGISEMMAAGKDIFAGEDPDAYVRRLREPWS
jgi:hypothetical protein